MKKEWKEFLLADAKPFVEGQIKINVETKNQKLIDYWLDKYNKEEELINTALMFWAGADYGLDSNFSSWMTTDEMGNFVEVVEKERVNPVVLEENDNDIKIQLLLCGQPDPLDKEKEYWCSRAYNTKTKKEIPNSRFYSIDPGECCTRSFGVIMFDTLTI